MKILFLDIDGVLCTLRAHYAYARRRRGIIDSWDPVGARVIKEVCKSGVEIVISSSWRHYCVNPYDKSDKSNILGVRLSEHGLTEHLHKDWKTGVSGSRGKEIRQWLNKHADVDKFIVLDDDIFDMEDITPHVIHTDPNDGMSASNIKKLYEWACINKKKK